MSNDIRQLVEEYQSALEDYLEQSDESTLFRGYEIGRNAIDQGMSVLDMAVAHHESLVNVLEQASSMEDNSLRAEKALEFCEECLAPFELITSRFHQSINMLSQRAISVATTNQRLKHEMEERSKIEKHLRERDEQLRHSQKMEAVGALAGGVAHEFNNLLQAIQAYTKFAMKGLGQSEQRFKDLEEVLKATDRAAGLTRQLLGFSRRQELKPVELNPNQVVDDLVKMIRPIIGETLTIKTVKDDQIGYVKADPVSLQQMLMNLCINSRDAMPSGGELLIKISNVCPHEIKNQMNTDDLSGSYVMFAVSDTGVGMSAEVVDRIFEPFFTTKEVGKGTGLGLSLVHGMVQQHNGMVEVDSSPGQGTTFKIYLPAVEVSPVVDSTIVHKPVVGNGELILFAEDEKIIRKAVIRTLEEAGYHVLASVNGQDAIETFKAHSQEISLVLLDMVMPQKNGKEVSDIIRQIKPDLPIIFCTGYTPDSALPELDMHDHDRLIFKPVDPDQLLRSVRGAFNEVAIL